MSLNILVVDDSAVMRAMIVKSLRLSGVPVSEVHQAANGEEGLQALDDNWIDLALVDINMPIMDGEQMIDRMRDNPETQNLPVIVVSTKAATRALRPFARWARGSYTNHSAPSLCGRL